MFSSSHTLAVMIKKRKKNNKKIFHPKFTEAMTYRLLVFVSSWSDFLDVVEVPALEGLAAGQVEAHRIAVEGVEGAEGAAEGEGAAVVTVESWSTLGRAAQRMW